MYSNWSELAGLGLSAPVVSWSWQRSRPVVLGRFSSLLKRMNACRPLGPLLLLKRRMQVVLPGCMVVVCVWTSSSPELWPESSKKVHKCLDSFPSMTPMSRYERCKDRWFGYVFTSGLYISCLGDNHNGWHKPSENKSTEYRVQSTEYRVQSTEFRFI